MDLTSLIFESLKDAKPGEFAQNLLLFTVAWSMMKRTIKAHFLSIEEKAERMAVSLVRLEATLDGIKQNHGERIERLEQINENRSA